MYKIGDYVVKANNGVCRVEKILTMDIPGGNSDRLYYLLVPQADKKATVYVPVDMADNLRKVMNEQEARGLISKMPQMEAIWIENEKQRDQEYKKAVQSTDPKLLVGIIKTLYFRMQDRLEHGKKSTATDERYFKLAEDHLYEELAFALGKDKGEMARLIKDTLDEERH